MNTRLLLLCFLGSYLLVAADRTEPYRLVLNHPQATEAQRAIAFRQMIENSHFSDRTAVVLEEALRAVEESEGALQADMGFWLISLLRQLGREQEALAWVSRLGFITQWQVAGPFSVGAALPEDWMTEALPEEVQGLNRNVHPWLLVSSADHEFPLPSAYGFVPASQFLFPNQLAQALFRAQFTLERKTSLVLGLGWSDELEVWVNGRPLLKQNATQQPHPDQAQVTFTLGRGTHTLAMVRATREDGVNLGFFARLTDENGAAVPTWPWQEPGSTRAPRRVSEHLHPLLAKASNAQERGELMFGRGIERDEKGMTGKDYLLQALEDGVTRPLIERLLEVGEDPNESWRLLKRYQQVQGEDAWSCVQLGQIAQTQERFWEARRLAQKAMTLDDTDWEAILLENNVLAGVGLAGQSLRATEQLHERLGDVPWILMDLCDLYWQMGMLDKTQEMLDLILSLRKLSSKFQGRQMELFERRNQTEALLAFGKALLRTKPETVDEWSHYAKMLLHHGRSAEAFTLLESQMNRLPDHPLLLETMGMVKADLGDEGANDLFMRALAINPQNSDLDALMALREGEDLGLFEPFRLEVDAPPKLSQDGVAIALRNQVRSLGANGVGTTWMQLEYWITNDRGPEHLRGHTFAYAPLRQTYRVLKAELWRQGQRIPLEAPKRFRISDVQYRMYYDLTGVRVAFPELKEGDRILLTYRIDDRPDRQLFGSYFGDVISFFDEFPVDHAQFVLILPKDVPLHMHTTPGEIPLKTVIQDGLTARIWSLRQVPIQEREPQMPPGNQGKPFLIYSNQPSWDALAQWYHELVKNQLQLEPELKALARSLLVEGDLEASVRNVHREVIRNTRYVALEYGIHGYKPYDVNRVYSRKFGDCKDKASLVVALLREMGIDASLAIIRTADRGPADTTIPVLALFNHALAYVPALDLFLDGTAEYSGMKELPGMDQGALVWVIDAQGKGSLRQTPLSVAEDNQLTHRIFMEVSDTGQIHFRGDLTVTGVQAARYRQFLQNPDLRHQSLERWLQSRFTGLTLASPPEATLSLDQSVRLQWSGDLSGLLEPEAEGFFLNLQFLNQMLLPQWAPNAQRQFPFWTLTPHREVVEVVIQAPDHWIPTLFPEVNVNSGAFSASLSIQPREAVLHLNYTMELNQREIPVAQYSDFRQQLQTHDSWLQGRLRWKVATP